MVTLRYAHIVGGRRKGSLLHLEMFKVPVKERLPDAAQDLCPGAHSDGLPLRVEDFNHGRKSWSHLRVDDINILIQVRPRPLIIQSDLRKGKGAAVRGESGFMT